MSDSALDGIAVIGLHGRFPGARTVEELWTVLMEGRETVSRFTDEQLAESGHDVAALKAAGNYVPARGVLEGVEMFDAAFFGVHAKEAEVMDPQHRLFLEGCWEALERAGYAPGRTKGSVGVFSGATYNTYYQRVLHRLVELREFVGPEQVMMGNEKDYLATRVAYKLDLRGPAVSVNTACSSSLVAICQACQALLTYQCDLALGGGVSVTVPQERGYFHQEGNIGSADGRTRSFDAAATGTAFSNGLSLVVLKRLSDAIADRDTIYCVIKGTAVNNDGLQRVSFGAPGVEGQSEAIALAQAIAGVDPDSISYVETHGTATPMGDPIEIAALTKAFRQGTSRRQFCAIGSIKSNLGHLDAAAGGAGLIKTALSLKHRVLPASLHFSTPNPKLDLENSPFFVNASRRDWRSESGPLRAGVSSFGTGGTNAHVIVEEAPLVEPSGPARHRQLLLLSAKTPSALEEATRNLSAHLKGHRELNPSDVEFTLQVGRAEFIHRRALVVESIEDAITQLDRLDPKRCFTAKQELRKPPVVFMFPGQGAQVAGMGSQLYRNEPTFREEVDRCAELLRPHLGEDLRPVMFAPEDSDRTCAQARLTQTRFAQPALFVFEYSLAKLLMSWGIQPSAMIGHSVGEYVAGCLAGVFSLEDALGLVARRAALVQSQPAGCMLAVRLPEAEILPQLSPSLSIAALNAPGLSVVSGPESEIVALESSLSSRGIAAKRLCTSHAFHSPMMDPVVAPFTEILRSVRLSAPTLPYISNVTAQWITPEEAVSPEYWAGHVRQTVRFAEGVAELMKDPRHVLLEVGPGQTLSQLARQHPNRKETQPVVAALPQPGEDEYRGFVAALGRLWLTDVPIDWSAMHEGSPRQRIVLPTYPFERTRFWPGPALVGEGGGMCATTQSTSVQAPIETSLATSQPTTTGEAPRVLAQTIVEPVDRKQKLMTDARTILEDLSGTSLKDVDPAMNFLELGLDSLLLTQAALLFQRKFGVPVSFQQVMEDLSSLEQLVAYLETRVPVAGDRTATPHALSKTDAVSRSSAPASAPSKTASSTGGESVEGQDKAFGPFRGIAKGASAGGLTPQQQEFLQKLLDRYVPKTRKSKEHTQRYRKRLADPRTVAGFRPFWKELVYPIVVERSLGSHVRDIDGRDYIDFSMGFGTNLLGHSPEFITEALQEQLKKGVEVGPQTPVAGRVAELMCQLTGMERCAFTNTGSEAVLAAIRIARTVTGRSKIVYFTGDYHGIFDEVLQRAAGTPEQQRLIPIAPGIPAAGVENVLILESNQPGSIEILRKLGSEVAAVIVEPVQSRHPDLQPREFLQQLRQVTSEFGSALVFDEVITGFRSHPGGVQALFDIRADIATYGKLIGGGMPIGALCGSARFLDALDGGFWSYGDGSVPEAGVTFFAGTYVRHPLAMAGAKAILEHLLEAGPALQRDLNERMGRLVAELNGFLRSEELAIHLEHFASMFWVRFDSTVKHSSLFFVMLRDKGIHIFEGRLFFLSTAHTADELAIFAAAFKEVLLELREGGFLPGKQGTVGSAVQPVSRAVEAPSAPSVKANPPVSQTQQQVVSRAESELPSSIERSGQIDAKPLGSSVPSAKPIQFGLYAFGNYPAEYSEDKYRVIIQGAQFADAHGFSSIWIPERHFHPVGGYSPNPSIIAAALALATKNIRLNAGSVVLPLHNPIRVAEEWSMVDNLSGGRVGISIASGWHPNDFVFAPDDFENRHQVCAEGLQVIRKLWSGESMESRAGSGGKVNIQLHPMPRQRELPVWFTCVQEATFIKAGEMGVGVLAMLTNQTLEEVGRKIALYREALVRHGHDPARGHVALLVHTYVDADRETAIAKARGPMREYLRSYLNNSQKRHESKNGSLELRGADIEYLLDRSFLDYLNGKALIGDPASCAQTVRKLAELGADEIGCFVDFGVDQESVLASLKHLHALKLECDKMWSGSQLERQTSPQAPTVSDGPARPQVVPLTDSQQGLWLVSKLVEEGARSYSEATTLELRGPLDDTLLEQAFQQVVDRHEGLRAQIDPERLHQTIVPTAPLALERTDLSKVPAHELPTKLKVEFSRIEKTALDFSSAPVVTAHLLKCTSDRHLLVLRFHHIFGNGPSYGVFFEDLTAAYQGLKQGGKIELGAPMQLSAYVRWREEQASSTQSSIERAFWLKEFEGNVPSLDLPSDFPRPARISCRGGRETHFISPELTATLRKSVGKLRSSLFTTLFTAFNACLHRISGQNDLVVGVPFEGAVRGLPGGDRLFANTTNLVPLRSRFDQETPFAEILSKTKSRVLAANEHQGYFLGRLMKDLGIRTDPSRFSFVAVSFNYDRGLFKKQVGELSVELLVDEVPFAGPPGTSNLELAVNVVDLGDRLRIDCNYSSDLYRAETIKRWLGHFETLLAAALENPACPLNQLPLLSTSQRDEILSTFNATSMEYDRNATVHGLFESQVGRTPDRVALVYDRQSWSYAQLNHRAEELAAALMASGVSEGTLVGLHCQRSLDMVAAVLAILKTGAAYVPLDPAFPAERLAIMIEDSGMPVIVTEKALDAALPSNTAKRVFLDAKLDSSQSVPKSRAAAASRGSGKSRAYVLFTSGSTGRPKGVEIPHSAVVNFLSSMRREPGLIPSDVLLAVTTLSFDIAGLELFLPLTTGARVVIASRDAAHDAEMLQELLRSSKATVMQATPATWRMLLDSGWTGSPSLKILCGGESMPQELRDALLPKCSELWNMYGPTETTIWSTVEHLKAKGKITIGRPIANTQVYVLDQKLQPLPIGLVGELFIGGDGVALGYFNRPDLTRERFVEDPFSAVPGARMYRTGDLARFLADGRLELLGRSDQQVKVRGYRIELGDVEAAIQQQPGVHQAVVICQDLPGGARLVAYVVVDPAAEFPIEIPDLRRGLKQILPEYMIPSQFMVLERFPLTPNGKVDRKALPALAAQATEPVTSEPPQGDIECRLARIWCQLLNVPSVGRNEGFFDLGGHSLLAANLASEIKKEMGVNLPLATLLTANTIAELAVKLRDQVGTQQHYGLVVPMQKQGTGQPFFCVHGAAGNVLLYRALAQRLAKAVPFYGIQCRGLDGETKPAETIEEMAATYISEMIAVQPTGPYLIGGYCMGGLVAYEMACQLVARGAQVTAVVLFDTYNPTVAGDELLKAGGFSYYRELAGFHWNNLASLPVSGWSKYLGEKSRMAVEAAQARLAAKFGPRRGHNGTTPTAGLQELNDAAGVSYRPGPCSAPLLVFKPKKNYSVFQDPTLGWSACAKAGLDVVELPMNPHAMLVEPYVGRLATEFEAKLGKLRTLTS